MTTSENANIYRDILNFVLDYHLKNEEKSNQGNSHDNIIILPEAESLTNCIDSYFKGALSSTPLNNYRQLIAGDNIFGIIGAICNILLNNSSTFYENSKFVVEVEKEVINYLCNKIGGEYSLFGDGVFTSGGAIANILGIQNAIKYYSSMNNNKRTVFLLNSSCHYSFKKAINLLGASIHKVHYIPARLLQSNSIKEIDQIFDQYINYNIIVAGIMGDTLSGTIDNLSLLRAIQVRYSAWIHLDACLLGPVILAKNLRSKIDGIEWADSISWDAHKLCSLPIHSSCLLLKKGFNHPMKWEEDAFTHEDPALKTIQCSRPPDAIKVWFMLKCTSPDVIDSYLVKLFNLANEIGNFITNKCSFLKLVKKVDSVIIIVNSSIPELNKIEIFDDIRSNIEEKGYLINFYKIDSEIFFRFPLINGNLSFEPIKEAVLFLNNEFRNLNT